MKIFLSLILIVFVSTDAMACKCRQPNEQLMQEAHLNVDIIVRAKIISTIGAWNGIAPSARLDITNILKGDKKLTRNLLINYNPSTAACGYNYQVDQSYIIGLYDTRESKNQAIKGHGYRAVDSCTGYYLRHYFETRKEEESK
jgi:hypothetical protein